MCKRFVDPTFSAQMRAFDSCTGVVFSGKLLSLPSGATVQEQVPFLVEYLERPIADHYLMKLPCSTVCLLNQADCVTSMIAVSSPLLAANFFFAAKAEVRAI